MLHSFSDSELTAIFSYSNIGVDVDNEFINEEKQKEIRESSAYIYGTLSNNPYIYLEDGEHVIKLFGRASKDNDFVPRLNQSFCDKGIVPKEIQPDTKSRPYIVVKINDLVNNEFFNKTPFIAAIKFTQDLLTNDNLRQKFNNWVFGVATNLNGYIALDKEKDAAAKQARAEVEGEREEQSNIDDVYLYKKSEYGGEGCHRLEDLSLHYKRVARDDFPFWISIDVVTGEFIIKAREDRTLIEVTYAKNGSSGSEVKSNLENHIIAINIKEALQKDIHGRFSEIFSFSHGEEDYYYIGQGLYFTQNAFNNLYEKKSQFPGHKVSPNNTTAANNKDPEPNSIQQAQATAIAPQGRCCTIS